MQIDIKDRQVRLTHRPAASAIKRRFGGGPRMRNHRGRSGEPGPSGDRTGSTSRHPARTTWSSISTAAASAPAPSACSGPAGCRRFPAWAIRWCPATSWSARSAMPATAASRRIGRDSVRARRQLLRRGARPVRRRRRAAGGARPRGWCRSTPDWASRACCWRWPPPRCITAAAGAAQPELIVGHGVLGRLLARLVVQSACGAADGVGNQSRPRRRAPTATRSSIPTATRAATIA